MQPSPGEHARMRWQRPGRGRPGGIEPDPAFGELDQGRAGGPRVAMQAQVAGRDRIHHDQEEIGRPRRRQGPRPRTRLPDPVAGPERPSQDRDDPDDDGETDPDQPPETLGMRLDPRDELRGRPQRHDEPGYRVDPRERDQDHRQHRHRAQDRAKSQRPRRGQARTTTQPKTPIAAKTQRFAIGISQTKC